MYWEDIGYLLYKKNFRENSLIVDVFTYNHGRCSAIVYGGTSRKVKNYLQIGNKIFVVWKSKSDNNIGYFSTEIVEAISPMFFDDRKKTTAILSATSILKLLLPEQQINKKIYNSFESLTKKIKNRDWIVQFILWELQLIKELGFDIDLSKNNVLNLNQIDDRYVNEKINITNLLFDVNIKNLSKMEVKKALIFTRNLFLKNFFYQNDLNFPRSRIQLENYYN